MPENLPLLLDSVPERLIGMRQSPLDVTVITPNGQKILILAVNPSEPASFLKQALQEFQESAQYTTYAFETTTGVQINEYIEIANYAFFNEEVSNMTINLVHAQYDIKKSRLQLKRVQDMIACPPISRCKVDDADMITVVEAVSKIDASQEDNNVSVAEPVGKKECNNTIVDKQIDVEDDVGEDNFFDKSSVAEADEKVDDVDVVENLSVKEPVECHGEMNAVGEEAQEVNHTAVSAEINSDQEGRKDVRLDEAPHILDDLTEGCRQESLHKETLASEVKEVSSSEKKDVQDDELAIGETLVAKSISNRAAELFAEKKLLPLQQEIFAPIKLGMFFNETLLRGSSIPKLILSPENGNGLKTNRIQIACKQPADCVKSISASGWNPPPLNRKAQGDLMYIEVVTGEYRYCHLKIDAIDIR